MHMAQFKYYCNKCKKGFRDRTDFDQHNRKHEGLKYHCDYYRPQRSWGTVMFLHVSVILSTISGGRRNMYSWQAGGKHPTGMLSCCFSRAGYQRWFNKCPSHVCRNSKSMRKSQFTSWSEVCWKSLLHYVGIMLYSFQLFRKSQIFSLFHIFVIIQVRLRRMGGILFSLPPANKVWGKVMFLHLSVIMFMGQEAWPGGVTRRYDQGVCVWPHCTHCILV